VNGKTADKDHDNTNKKNVALVINYVNTTLEFYGIPESQRVNYSFLLDMQSFYSYRSEKLL